jgi:hypothetical protein
MALANSLAYYNMATITTEKSFMVQNPGLILIISRIPKVKLLV